VLVTRGLTVSANAMRGARTAGAGMAALLLAVLGPQSRAQSTPDARLWAEIEQLARAPAPLTTDPATGEPIPDFEAAAEQADRLARRCRQFLANYPGGPQALQVARIELQALFEHDCLRNS